MKQMLFLVPLVGLAGLLFAVFLRLYVIRQDPGNDKMREIADAIAEGARAFLTSEYRILIVFVAILFVVIGLGTRSWVTAGCFLVGSIFLWRSNSRRQMISGTVPTMLIQIKSMQVPHLKFVNKIQQVLLIFFAEIGIFGKGTEQTGK